MEADGGQAEAAQDMQITIVRTRMEASGDSKLYNTIMGATSAPINIINQLSIHRILTHNSPTTFSIPLLLNFHHPPFLFLGPFATYFILWSKIPYSFLSLSSRQLPLTNPYWSCKTIDSPKLRTSHYAMAQTEIPS